MTETWQSVQGRLRRWKLHKANWNLFQMQREHSINPNAFLECDNPTQLFTSLIYQAAKEANSPNLGKAKAPSQTLV